MARATCARSYPRPIRRSSRDWKNVNSTVRPQYTSAAATYASRFLKSALPTSWERRKTSALAMVTPRNETSAVSFIIAMNSLPVGGMITRNACGSTTLRIFCPYVMPSASAASPCPPATDWMPARKISVM